MHHRYRPGRLIAVLGALLAFSSIACVAADLAVKRVYMASEDIFKIAQRPDGSIGICRQGGVDLLDAGGIARSVARPGEGEILYLADGGAYHGVVRHRAGAADFAPTASFELRDGEGRLLWRTGETEDVTYAISRSGDVVGMSLNINAPERNAIHFYDRGLIVAEAPVPYLETGRFDPAGSLFLAVSARDGLRAFDKRGSEIWSEPDVRLFAAGEEAGTVAVVGQGGLRVIRGGAVAGAVDLGGLLVRRVAVAPDGSRIAIAGKHEIRVYDGALAHLWSTRTESEALSWTSVDVASGDGYVMAGLARDLGPGTDPDSRHPDGEVRAYDATGTLLHRGSMSFSTWNIWTPTVLIDRSGKGATITTRRAVYRTVLP